MGGKSSTLNQAEATEAVLAATANETSASQEKTVVDGLLLGPILLFHGVDESTKRIKISILSVVTGM